MATVAMLLKLYEHDLNTAECNMINVQVYIGLREIMDGYVLSLSWSSNFKLM